MKKTTRRSNAVSWVFFLVLAIAAVAFFGCSGSNEAVTGNNPGGTTRTAPIKANEVSPARPAPEYVPGEVLVKLKKKVANADAFASEVAGISSRTGVGLSMKKHFNFINVSSLTITSGVDVLTAIKKLSNDPEVAYAEPNYIYHAHLDPNDPNFTNGNLWGLHNTGQTIDGQAGIADADIDAPEAWNLSTGSSDVVVAVIDTGVDYTHPDLAANMWINPGEIPANGIDDDGNGYIDDVYGINAITGSGNPMDDHYHGTHCAGTIAGVGDNSIGVAGVCWTAKIMALKFLSSGGAGTTDDAIECVQYAYMMKTRTTNPVNLLLTSNSWGGGGYSQALKDAIDATGNADMLFVASAGNENNNNDVGPTYPASYESLNIISVAASDNRDARAWFSNYGAVSVDLTAPGVNIYSTRLSNTYGFLSGTSMACPHVSGACALVKSYIPTLSAMAIKARILRSVDVLSAWSGVVATGGRLNVYNALVAADLPYLANINPGYGQIGDTITLSGINFGSSQGSSYVQFGGGVNASSYTSWSDSQIVCVVPDGAISGNLTVVSPGGSSNAMYFHVVSGLYSYDNTVPYQWVDTSGGTNTGITGDDAYADVPIGFDFSFYGNTYNTVRVTSNGYMHFGTETDVVFQNASIPNPALPNNIICPFWDDLDPSLGGVIRYLQSGTAPNRTLTIEWNDVPHYGGTNGGTFQAILYEGSNQIKFQYQDVDFGDSRWNNGASATVGLENSDGSYGDQYSYNTAALVTGRGVSNNLGILWTFYTRPRAPVSLSARAVSSSQIDLSWTDNSDNETGFKIERKTGSGSYSEIATVSSNVTSYSNVSLTANTTYTYRVRSYNPSFNSPYSNEASATTSGGAGPTATGEGGLCFIATASFGTPMAKEVQVLCTFRDRYLIPNPVGKAFTDTYYSLSPPMAETIRNNEGAKAVVRTVLSPIVAAAQFCVNSSFDPALGLVFLLASSLVYLKFKTRKKDTK